MNQLKAALIGIGGFGKSHTAMISKLASEGIISCAAFCEPNADKFEKERDILQSLGAQHYTDYRDMLKHPDLDFVIIATPIPLHKRMCIDALEQGVPVLLEKPPAVAIEDLDAMIEVQQRIGQPVAVNFQNTSSQSFLQLLQSIREGRIGKVASVVAVGMWKRTQQYYERNNWAGTLRYNGEYVLDGSMCNALSHLWQNSLLAAGAGDPEQAQPQWIEAELYKGHPIESEDTVCAKIRSKNGVLVHMYTTLCNENNDTPYIKVIGDKGELQWNYDQSLRLTDGEGKIHNFEFEKEDLMRNMYMNLIRRIRGEETKLFCDLAACRNFVLTANGAFTSSGLVHPIPEGALDIASDETTVTTAIKGIRELVKEASEKQQLFSETAVQWAVRTQRVDLRDYRQLQLG
ncbi:Gfo/Idh/MocA family protein [Paenibacillus cremeus]|uniref:Gfo/Idh/MocA family protein n=1 Tax=Paenibacillus cremeus TaxID=2163881 RepID=UPI001647FC71|nr:Gfo/Idh/MocA family oxidoreductase [Paenibacillus cremeus]